MSTNQRKGSREPGDLTDESFTPPHGDPEKAHLDQEDDQNDVGAPDEDVKEQVGDMDNEGPGPAGGRTDNKAGG